MTSEGMDEEIERRKGEKGERGRMGGGKEGKKKKEGFPVQV